ncbi:hypothetical protein NMY22_g5897 [Coprinellus aureogranulatus]|nr:hypothetical protein NMY22_g5897 [Coprinellus aureogranulatus]
MHGATFLSLRSLAVLTLWAGLSLTLSTAKPVYLPGSTGQELKARAVSCFPLSRDEASRLPGWPKIQDFFARTSGDNYDALELNYPETPDRPADGCMDVAEIPINYAAEPSCTTSEQLLQGTVDGTTQTITFTEKVGTEQKTSWTVTNATTIAAEESSIGVGVEFSVNFGFPGFGGSVTTSVNAVFTNTRSNTFETTSSNMIETKFEFVNNDGQQCSFHKSTTACTATSSGRAPIIAKGTILARYPDPVPRVDLPDEGSHYYWFANFEDILSEEERTSWIEFQGPATLSSVTAYGTDCTPQA